MRKEVIFALILGSLIGGIILYGIKLANNAASLQSNEPTTVETPLPTPTHTAKELTISTPDNHDVVFESTIPLKGSSRPGSTIVIISDKHEEILDTNENGSFETKINLIGGENNILISSFSSDTLIASSSIQVIYTKSVIE